MVLQVSNSKIDLWRKCRYAYHLRHTEKLRRKRTARPLVFGRIVHEMVEEYVNKRNPFLKLKKIEKEQGKLFRSQQEELGQILDDTRIIMTEYFAHWEGQPASKQLEYVRMSGKSAEYKFEVEIAKGIILIGKIDAIGKMNRLRWLVEHKSGARFPNDDHRWRNLQSAIYIRVNDMLGLSPVDGTLWDYIRSKPPTAPQIKKNGEVARRAIDTLPLKVTDFLEEHGQDPKKFASLLKLAEANRKSYFQRIVTPVKKKVIDRLWPDVITTAQEIGDNAHKSKPKTIGRHCEWCDFEPICRAELTGADDQFVKEKDYEKAGKAPEWEPDFEG